MQQRYALPDCLIRDKLLKISLFLPNLTQGDRDKRHTYLPAGIKIFD
jgi:hypothetical protein